MSDKRQIRTEQASGRNWIELQRLFLGNSELSRSWSMKDRIRAGVHLQGAAAQMAFKKVLLSGTATGILAFVEGAVAGWCAVDPANTQIGHAYSLKHGVTRDSFQWMIHDLFVDRRFLEMGVERALVYAAVQLAREHGAWEILAFPALKDVPVFESMGFERGELLTESLQAMRLSLETASRPGKERVSWSNL